MHLKFLYKISTDIFTYIEINPFMGFVLPPLCLRFHFQNRTEKQFKIKVEKKTVNLSKKISRSRTSFEV